MAMQSWPERPLPAQVLVVPSYEYSPKIIEERAAAEALEETIPQTSLILETTLPLAGQSAAERDMAAALRQKDILLREMQHRVANSLQIIASMLLLKARDVRSEETRQHLRDAHRRIMSVAIVQQQLDASRHGGHIEIGPYLSRLCDSLTASLVDDDRPVSIKVQAERGRIASAAAVSIGLIVAELVINALKHAFVDDTAAALIVVAYEADGASWRLTVSDNGIGTPDGPGEAKAGLGTGIVEALARQLDARVEISKGSNGGAGTSVTITQGPFGLRLPNARPLRAQSGPIAPQRGGFCRRPHANPQPGMNRKDPIMTLNFPNRSRSFDEGRRAIRFIGHDGMREVPFVVEAAALAIADPAEDTEASSLVAFDQAREAIYAAARKAYSRARRKVYFLSAADLPTVN